MPFEQSRRTFPNPHYGSGVARRHIRLTSHSGYVESHLVDIFHELRCRVEHDGRVITRVTGETIRVPTSACPSAVAALEELVGMEIGIDMATFYADGRARRNCTHLFHLAVLCAAQAGRTKTNRTYDAIVPDETDSPVEISVLCDGAEVHRWTIRSGKITHPQSLAGQPLLAGFTSWASKAFTGPALEAANVLSQTYFIAQARRYDTDAVAGEVLGINSPMLGVCFAYSPSQVETARYLGGNYRDIPEGGAIPD